MQKHREEFFYQYYFLLTDGGPRLKAGHNGILIYGGRKFLTPTPS
jgi:hypothetical protein